MINKLLSGAIFIILLIIAVESGYYWGIMSSRKISQPLITNEPNNDNSPDLIQATPASQDPNAQIKANERIVELIKLIQQSDNHTQSGEINKAIEFLIKSSTLKSEISRLGYKDYYTVLKPVPELTNLPNDDEFNSKILAELKRLDFASLSDAHNNDLAKVFYRLGLIAFQNDRKELVSSLWTAMVNLSPEWSHFQLELANYYLAAGDQLGARRSIEYCLNFKFPDEICSSFLLNEIQNNQPQPVGFMNDRIQSEISND